MGIIELSAVKPGMVLAKSVHSHLGILLAAESRELTEKDILLFEVWGVKEVDIEGVEPSISREQRISEILGKAEIAAIDAEIETKFSHLPENEITIEMKKVVRKIRIEELIEKKGQNYG